MPMSESGPTRNEKAPTPETDAIALDLPTMGGADAATQRDIWTALAHERAVGIGEHREATQVTLESGISATMTIDIRRKMTRDSRLASC